MKKKNLHSYCYYQLFNKNIIISENNYNIKIIHKIQAYLTWIRNWTSKEKLIQCVLSALSFSYLPGVIKTGLANIL